MPRAPRLKGESSVYHVIQRGNERKNIFQDDDDKIRFLETLSRMKKKYNFKVYGYCLMDNHVHIIIDVNNKDISAVMKSINVSYVSYFNHKYNRVGHLFQDRFKSELVKNDRYLLALSRYIHMNPVKANMVGNPSEYQWSSYNIYIGKANDYHSLIEAMLVLGIMSQNPKLAIMKYIDFVSNEDESMQGQGGSFLDVPSDGENGKSKEREEVLSLIQGVVREKGLQLSEVLSKQTPHKDVRNEAIKFLRHKTKLSLSEIGVIFGGMSHSTISKILKSLDT